MKLLVSRGALNHKALQQAGAVVLGRGRRVLVQVGSEGGDRLPGLLRQGAVARDQAGDTDYKNNVAA